VLAKYEVCCVSPGGECDCPLSFSNLSTVKRQHVTNSASFCVCVCE